MKKYTKHIALACLSAISAGNAFAADYLIDGEKLVSDNIAFGAAYSNDGTTINMINSSHIEGPTAIRAGKIFDIQGDSSTNTIVGDIKMSGSGSGVNFLSGNFDFYAHPANGGIITIKNSAYTPEEATTIAAGVNIKFNNNVVFEATYTEQAVTIAGNIVLGMTSTNEYASITYSSDGPHRTPTATVESGATLTIELDDLFSADALDSCYFGNIAEMYDTITLSFKNGAVVSDDYFTFENGQIVFTKHVDLNTFIPEPSTYAAVFGALVLALAAYRRRK